MLRKYFESLGIKKDDKKEDPKEKDDDKDEGFPKIHDCFTIYEGPSTRLSIHQHKARASRDLLRATRNPPLP
jgi:hypothetical protein